MTPALPAADARHLSVVQGPDPAARGQGTGPAASAAPLVGYVVLVPEGTDPAELLALRGLHAEVLPLPSPDGGPETAGRARTGECAVTSVPDAASAPQAPGSIRTDTARHTAEVEGRALELTYLEFQLLAHFVAHPYRVHTRDHLVTTLWGYSHIGDGRTVDVHIARLRRKLGRSHRDSIVTVRRVGYKYVPDVCGR